MKDFIEGLGLSIQEILIIILPGLAASYFINQINFICREIDLFGNPSSLIGGLKLFGAAYFLGYVVYVISTPLDRLYNWLKEKKLKTKFHNAISDEGLDYFDLSEKESVLEKIYIPFAKESHNLVVKVSNLKPVELRFNSNGDSQNFFDAYQYATRVLLNEATSMYMEVYRYYATARFFRSMTLVFAIGFLIGFFVDLEIHALLLLGSAIISLYVFTARWRKAQNVAFKNFIIYETRYQKIKM